MPAPFPLSAPLSPEEAAALFAPFVAGRERVALAVSGGPDSLALAFCAQRAGLVCTAFIVDHALRPESGEEASQTKKTLEALGIETDILRWEHSPLESRIHVVARQARYDLLLAACRQRGLATLLLAHHRDDQAETILMRLAKGSGLHGLAGIAPVTERETIRLVRPFLSVPKERLVATCEAAGVLFARDPSNNSPHYARGRLRRVREALTAEGLTVERLLDLGERAGEAAQALDFYADNFLRANGARLPDGAMRLDLASFRALPQAVALRALANALQAVHRADYAPERRALKALYFFLDGQDMDLKDAQKQSHARAGGHPGPLKTKGCSGPLDPRLRGGDMSLCDPTNLTCDSPARLGSFRAGTRSLHGCLVQKAGDGSAALLFREPNAIAPACPIAPGERLIWDGRWEIALAPEAAPGEIRPLGFQPHAVLDRLAPGLRRLIPQGRRRAGLPALWREGLLIAILPLSSADQAVGEIVGQPLF